MHPPTRNPFENRPPGDPGTEGFLRKLEGSETADAYREAMGEQRGSTTMDTSTPELSHEEIAQLQAAEARLRETKQKKELEQLRADYLAWAREFNLGGDDPQAWLDDTFVFHLDGTVETLGDLSIHVVPPPDRLPPNLIRVNGKLDLQGNRFTSLVSLGGLPGEVQGDLDLDGNFLESLEGLPQQIGGTLYVAGNPIRTLDGLRGKKIGGDLFLFLVPATSIPEDIELQGAVLVSPTQTALIQDARSKGYEVVELSE